MSRFSRKSNITVIYLILLGCLLFGLLSACGTPSSSTEPVNGEPQNDNEKPLVVPVLDKPEGIPDRVDVFYFRRPTQCTECRCNEERITRVVKMDFQDEMDKGNLTFKVLEIGDPENTELINKYVAFGGQLFIDIVKDDVAHVTEIKEIGDLDCRGDNEGFDRVIKDVIERSLSG